MNRFLLFAGLFMASHQSPAQQARSERKFTIVADLSHWDSTFVTLTINGINEISDSVRNGKFTYTGTIEGIKEATFAIQKKNLIATSPLFIESGDIHIADVATNVSQLIITGTPANDEMKQLYEKVQSLYPMLAEGSEEQKEKGRIDFARTYMKEHPSSPVSLRLYQSYIFRSGITPEEKLADLSVLHKSLLESFNGKSIVHKLNSQINTGLGRIAPEFSQKDTTGREVSLKSFRGKYVLVDFWAGWCVPCREENPAIKKVYAHFKEKGFSILSVSLDRDRKNWVKAITDDKLTWSHVSDLKYWDNAVAKQYLIESIPDNFLLDPKGVIIARNLKGEGLAEKLTALLP